MEPVSFPMAREKLTQMVADIPEVRTNPLLVDQDSVVAVDRLIAVEQVARNIAGSGPADLQARPYPSQWQRHIEVKHGWNIFVRSIRPEDEPLVRNFLQHESREDLRLRFFASVKEFSHAFIAPLTELDYARAMAFVALDEASGEMIGMVRIHSDSIHESGEYAILLRSDLKGRGLGWALMKLIIEYAKSEGFRRISGEVLQENFPMLNMCRELGFSIKSDSKDYTLCSVTLELGG